MPIFVRKDDRLPSPHDRDDRVRRAEVDPDHCARH
jgi:hypothetical protein